MKLGLSLCEMEPHHSVVVRSKGTMDQALGTGGTWQSGILFYLWLLKLPTWPQVGTRWVICPHSWSSTAEKSMSSPPKCTQTSHGSLGADPARCPSYPAFPAERLQQHDMHTDGGSHTWRRLVMLFLHPGLSVGGF